MQRRRQRLGHGIHISSTAVAKDNTKGIVGESVKFVKRSPIRMSKPLVPEFPIKGAMRDQIEEMASALRGVLDAEG